MKNHKKKVLTTNNNYNSHSKKNKKSIKHNNYQHNINKHKRLIGSVSSVKFQIQKHCETSFKTKLAIISHLKAILLARQVMAGEKKLFKLSKVIWIDQVPQWE